MTEAELRKCVIEDQLELFDPEDVSGENERETYPLTGDED